MLPEDLTQNIGNTPCPVPSEQRPLNEYQDLQESWFFRWGLLDVPTYYRKMVWVWVWSWLVTGPVVAASLPPAKYPAKFVLVGAIAALLLPALALLRLYLGWSYINSRLTSTSVFYEESGWYDGQTWSKPPEAIAQDQLVATYQVQPILVRLQKTLIGLGLGVAVTIAIVQLL